MPEHYKEVYPGARVNLHYRRSRGARPPKAGALFIVIPTFACPKYFSTFSRKWRFYWAFSLFSPKILTKFSIFQKLENTLFYVFAHPPQAYLFSLLVGDYDAAMTLPEPARDILEVCNLEFVVREGAA